MSKTRALIFLGMIVILVSCTIPTDPLPYAPGTGGIYDPSNPPTDNGNGGITLPRIPQKPVKPY